MMYQKTITNTYNENDKNIDLESGENTSPITQISLNTGLFNYIKGIYFFTGIGWSTLLVIAEIMSFTINKNNINLLFWIYLLIGFGLTILTIFISIIPSDVIILEDGNKKEIIPWWKIISYELFSFSIGLMISPVIFIINQQNIIIFPICIIITNFIFCTMSIFTWTRKDMDGLKLYVPLITCISGLIILGFIEIILACLGFDKIVCILSFGTSIISIIVFSGLIYVDTLKAIESYNESGLNTIKCSIEIVLDLVNILLDLIRIISCLLENLDN